MLVRLGVLVCNIVCGDVALVLVKIEYSVALVGQIFQHVSHWANVLLFNVVKRCETV